MKDPGNVPAPVFRAQQRTIDFSGVPNFRVTRLLAITNLTARQDIYDAGDPELGYTVVNGAVLTLAADTRPMDDGDVLQVFYEDGTAALPANSATADRQDAAFAKLEAVRALVAGSTVTADTSGTITPGGVATPVAANLTRQFIEITNTGGDPLSYRWGAPASATIGHILSPGQSVRYDSKVPTAALNLFSTNGTSFFVTTG